MPNYTRTLSDRRPAPKRRRNWRSMIAAPFVVLVLLAGGVWLLAEAGSNNAAGGSTAVGVALPIANAPQTILGLQVNEPAVDHGRLPLDTPVTQLYEIVNTGTGPAEFGKPTIEVLEGCCPPPLLMTQMVVEPGQTASVGFNTQMHAGMDGPHLFHITVPFRTAEGEDALHLYFKGDFQG